MDFDGTIVESLGVLRTIYESFVTSNFGLTCPPAFDSVSHLTVPECMQVCSDLGDQTTSIPELVASYDELIAQRVVELAPREGLVDFWQVLRRNEIEIGIVSSAQNIIIASWLRRWALEESVSCVIGREDVRIPKPHPTPYLKALEVLRVTNHESIAIEDSIGGATSSLDAGIPTFHIGNETPPCSVFPVGSFRQIQDRLGVT